MVPEVGGSKPLGHPTFHAVGRKSSKRASNQPSYSASAVLPDPLAPMIATVRELKGFITVFLAVVLNAGGRTGLPWAVPGQESGVADRTLTGDSFGRTGDPPRREEKRVGGPTNGRPE